MTPSVSSKGHCSEVFGSKEDTAIDSSGSAKGSADDRQGSQLEQLLALAAGLPDSDKLRLLATLLSGHGPTK